MEEADYCFGTGHGCVAEGFGLGHEGTPQASVLITPTALHVVEGCDRMETSLAMKLN